MLYWPLLVCLVSTCYFVGLIWIIQLVQYPLFAAVGQESFLAYHAQHSQRIVFALGLPFLLSFVGALLLFWFHPLSVPLWSIVLNLLLGCSVWVFTGLISVPLHRSLGDGYSASIIQRLVTTNWLRTIIWTAQALLLLGMLAVSIHAL